MADGPPRMLRRGWAVPLLRRRREAQASLLGTAGTDQEYRTPSARVSLVIDHYEDDWSRLAYVLIWGLAAVLDPGSAEHARAIALLREKYPQYLTMAIQKQPVIKVTPRRSKFWSTEGA